MFKYDWSKFDAPLGLVFTIGSVVVYGLMNQFEEFDVYTAGIAGLMAWMTILLSPGPTRRQHLQGVVIYLVVGAALTWLAHFMMPLGWIRILSMAVVAFVGHLFMLRGNHAFMTAWCLVYWYLLAPLFLSGSGFRAVMLAHVVGVAIVFGLNLLKPVSKRASPQEESGAPAEAPPPFGLIVRFASVVGIAIAAGVAAGSRWLSTDPTIIANGTLNVVSPSLKTTWIGGAERVILGTLGVVGGFYLGWFFPQQSVGYVVTLLFSFLALATTRVSFSVLIGLIFFMLAYPWGVMHSDVGHLIANEKIIGEAVGVLVALGAIAVLTLLQRRAEASVHVR